jgi:hypothetical protein
VWIHKPRRSGGVRWSTNWYVPLLYGLHWRTCGYYVKVGVVWVSELTGWVLWALIPERERELLVHISLLYFLSFVLLLTHCVFLCIRHLFPFSTLSRYLSCISSLWISSCVIWRSWLKYWSKECCEKFRLSVRKRSIALRSTSLQLRDAFLATACGSQAGPGGHGARQPRYSRDKLFRRALLLTELKQVYRTLTGIVTDWAETGLPNPGTLVSAPLDTMHWSRSREAISSAIKYQIRQWRSTASAAPDISKNRNFI